MHTRAMCCTPTQAQCCKHPSSLLDTDRQTDVVLMEGTTDEMEQLGRPKPDSLIRDNPNSPLDDVNITKECTIFGILQTCRTHIHI